MKIKNVLPDYLFVNDNEEKEFYENCFNVKNLKVGEWNYTKIEQQNVNYYIAKPLDSYESVSKKLNIDINLLKEKNNNETIFIGKKLYY